MLELNSKMQFKSLALRRALIIIHPLLIMAYFICFFVLPTWLFVTIAILQMSQELLFGGCILTHLQMGKSDDASFWHYLLTKARIPHNARKVKIIVTWLAPVTLILLKILI